MPAPMSPSQVRALLAARRAPLPATAGAQTRGATGSGRTIPVVSSLSHAARQIGVSLRRDPVGYSAFKLLGLVPGAGLLPDDTLADLVRIVRPGFRRPLTLPERNFIFQIAAQQGRRPGTQWQMPVSRDFTRDEVLRIRRELPVTTPQESSELVRHLNKVFERPGVTQHLQNQGLSMPQIKRLQRNLVLAAGQAHLQPYQPLASHSIDHGARFIETQEMLRARAMRRAPQPSRPPRNTFLENSRARTGTEFTNNVMAGAAMSLMRRRR